MQGKSGIFDLAQGGLLSDIFFINFDFAEDTSSTDSETADKFDRHIRLARSRHGVSACEKVFFICRIIHIIKFVLYIRGDTFFISPPCRKRGVSSRSEEGRRRSTG